MAHVVVMGAGLGGMPMAYEMKEQLRPEDRVTVVEQGLRLSSSCRPTRGSRCAGASARTSNFEAAPLPGEEGHRLQSGRASSACIRSDNQLELGDGATLDYDYLVIATGPKLAFDEIEGLRARRAHAVDLPCRPCGARGASAWDAFVKDPGPIVVGAVQGASCFGPAYEFAFIMETDLRRRKIRDQVPMTFVTAEPYIGHLGLGGVGDSKGDARVGAARASTSSGSATPR